MACSDQKATKSYRKAVIDLLDTNFSKLNSVLEGCLEVFARKAFEAKLISEQVMKVKSFTGMIGEFKAGMDWCKNTLEIQSRCTDFIEILESLGGPAKTAAKDLNVKLLILDEKHEVFSVEPHSCEGTEKIVNLLHTRIEQVPELAVIAAGLKKRFRQLLIVVKKSLTNVDISDVKLIISSTLVDNSCRVSDTIRLYLYKLRKFENVEEILDFLIEYRFIGYLNYGLLKEISNLKNDENISKAFKSYETEYFCNLLKSSKFNLLMQVFCEYPDLSPTTAIGLPEIMFQLEDSWKNESMETWQRYMEINFPWSGSLAVKEVSASCILITYACHPAKYNDILKDICNPEILERLKSDEISFHILESETSVALQPSVVCDFELDHIQMVEAIQCTEFFNKDTAELVVSAPSLKNLMPNKASEYVDRAHTYVDSILTNKNILSSTPETKQLPEIKTEIEEVQKKIQHLDTNYQKMTQDVEVLCQNISKLVVQDVIVAAKTKISFQELQSRHDVFQHHQNEHEKKLNKLETDINHKADSKHLVSIEECLESLKAIQVQQSERMNEIFEDLISRVQMNERNARRQSRTGVPLEESIEAIQEPSHEDLKQSLKEAHHNISLMRLYEQQAVNRPKLDSGISITSTETLQLQLPHECPIQSLSVTRPDSGFNSLAVTRETSSSQLKTYQVPTTQISETPTDP